MFQLYLMSMAFNTEGITGIATSLIGPYFGLVLLIALLTDTVRTRLFDLVATAGFSVCSGLAYLVSPSVGAAALTGLTFLCTGYCVMRLQHSLS
ncbi:hypothetical protein [Halalkalicoccus subterraneus]|uniref:hypothetical protein n=1 Tax=Halalkalicoccus subterraneus TaxID=2675002 RepID=UPI001B875FFB|nr:hypothetical protein [Halalkalicoccus subterraneus]